jgi:fused signal recognition particle receptor
MSFFKKLRDKMFKSSDRIAQGLDSIVEGAAPEGMPDASAAPSARETGPAPAKPPGACWTMPCWNAWKTC